MNTALKERITPDAALTWSAALWLAIATIGQWVFLTYVAIVFGGSALLGHWEVWNDRLSQGHVVGDVFGNGVVAAHLVLAALVLGAGPLQFIPRIRARFPAVHRWVGRIYMAGVALATLSGLYMLRTRDIGSLSLNLGFVLQALVIGVFLFFALRYAIARQIDRHQRWALRFFMVSSIALTYRVIFMIWVLATGGTGINFETGEGAFLDVMAIGQFFPLLVLEVYFRTKERKGATAKYWMAGVLGTAAGATGLGILLLAVGLWFK
jgi:hypothetical protein